MANAQNPANYAKAIKECNLKKHLTFLAADSLKGRDTGSQGQKIAANFLAEYYKNKGLLPLINLTDSSKTYLQRYELQRVKSFGGLYRYVSMANPRRGKVDTVGTENVLGYIPGSQYPDQYIIITSHYDHIGVSPNGQINNGADDDASGTVAVMELANAFAQAYKNGHGPKRSIIFMNVTGEEKGLLGSEHFVQNPPVPLTSIVANLNIDMIGRSDSEHKHNKNYVYLIGSDKLSSELHTISEQANQEYAKLSLDYTFNSPDDPNRFYYRSDHYNFAQKGIPVIFYFRGVHPDYHQPGDDVEKIEFNSLQKITKLIFHTTWELANRENRIVVDSNKP
jgi:Zn-dependent M28 family amino/carboxypeptidase